MKALAVKQPWASLIVSGQKTIENRTWKTSYRGPVLIHASAIKSDEEMRSYMALRDSRDLPRNAGAPITWGNCPAGGIIGTADIVDCVTKSDDPWFFGPVGFVLANARRLPFMPCKGKLGFFDVDYREGGAA